MAASSVRVGQKAPDFELPDENMKNHKLSDYRGKKTILAFFPAAESPVCTAEMCALRDSLDELRDYGAQVLGISVDGPFAKNVKWALPGSLFVFDPLSLLCGISSTFFTK